MKGIRHTGIVVSDLKRSLHFYQDLLGFKIVRTMEESEEFLEQITGIKGVRLTTVKLAADDGNLIELLHYVFPEAKENTGNSLTRIGCTHVAFSTSDINSDYERLAGEAVEFIGAPRLSPDGKAKVSFMKDPDGTFIELVEWIKDK